MAPIEIYNNLLARKLIAEFEKRNIEGYYCRTKEDARNKALELLPNHAVVSCGGSATLQEIGLRKALTAGSYDFLDPLGVRGASEMDKIAHKAMEADYYFCSSNAVTWDGQLVNADGYGNRTSALIFGPKNVIVIAGINKVVPNLDAAILRIRAIAAPLILLKFQPADFTDFDVLTEAGKQAEGHLVITSMTTMKGRIKVILVGKNLGF